MLFASALRTFSSAAAIYASGLLILNPAYTRAQTPAERLAAHSEEFRPEVIKVTEGVYVAVGYALANSILIEGPDGAIIVDATGSAASGEQVRAAFAVRSRQPLKALIYTHSHPDHLGGARALVGEAKPAVYAHASWGTHNDAVLAPELNRRSKLQFGASLTPAELINAGIGLKAQAGAPGADPPLPPTRTFATRLDTTLAGVRVVLQYAPGETDDQIYVWLPERKVLLPGDNFYKAFPNLYPIRGARFRNVTEWANSLDRMLQEGEINYLLPSHTRPVVGAAQVKSALTNYRDAIRYVYEATVTGINAGLPPVELARQIVLPAHLARDPYLQEYYGTVEWSARAIYAGLLGWFDGNATQLFPLAARERAERTLRLAGGAYKLLAAARQALAQDDAQWAAELTDHLLALRPTDAAAQQVKAAALTALGNKQLNANARHWYLAQAQQLRSSSTAAKLKEQ